MRNEGGGFAANIYGRCPKVACDWGLSRIVISSVSENSLPFAVKWSMFGNIKREPCSP